jgi:hypothetical protein
MKRALLAIVLLTLAIPVAADDGVLLPLLLASNCGKPPYFTPLEPWHGADGTEWATELWVHNGSPNDVPIELCTNLCDVRLLPPDGIQQIGGIGGICAPLFAAKGPLVVPAGFDYALWVVETTRGRRFSIPAVRAAAMHRTPFHVMGIHVNPSVRHTVRLYELAGNERTGVTVRLIANDGRELSSRKVSLSAPPHAGAAYYVPGFAQFGSLAELFPDVVNWPAIVHLQIVPESSDRLLWAMVTITDNITQDVTVIAPDQGP